MPRPIDPSQSWRPDFLDQSSPGEPANAPDSSPPSWYRTYARSSLDDEPDHHDPDLDILTAASTPIHTNDGSSTLFTSPLNRLDRLDLNRSSPKNHDRKKTQSSFSSLNFSNKYHAHQYRSPQLHSEVKIAKHEMRPKGDEDLEGSNNEIGDLTFVEVTESITAQEVDRSNCPLVHLQPPTYIRKRKADVENTPTLPTARNMSCAVEDMSGIISNMTSDSLSKISFSASDSTPCPPQPRKKLKSNSTSQQTTPSQPSRVNGSLLNFTSSKKLSASNVPLLNKLNSAVIETRDMSTPGISLPSASQHSSSKTRASATPIGHSTPANSRPNSPTYVTELSDEEVNGFKFVKQKFKYETPKAQQDSKRYSEWQHYNSKGSIKEYHATNPDSVPIDNYRIVGKLPVSAVGLMNEEDRDVHIADKRISDPYLLVPPSNAQKYHSPDLLIRYSRSTNRLPLLDHFDRILDLDEMKMLLGDGNSVRNFYDHVISSSESGMRSFLKKERLRWHPDKWESRLEDSPFDKEVIDRLSQVINILLEELP